MCGCTMLWVSSVKGLALRRIGPDLGWRLSREPFFCLCTNWIEAWRWSETSRDGLEL